MDFNEFHPESRQLAKRIARFMQSNEGDFNRLALDIHAWQVSRDPVLAALTDSVPSDWTEITGVPVSLFKETAVGTLGDEPARATFMTSGTTQGTRGVHRLRSTLLYDLGAFQWAAAQGPPLPSQIVALLDAPVQRPESSLSHMVALFPNFSSPAGEVNWFLNEGRLQREMLNEHIRSLKGPCYLAATSFALAEWLAGQTVPLPVGSVVMLTGGFKGRTVAFNSDELYARCEHQLRPARILTEYGMTELSSQLWGAQDGPFVPPHWLRAIALNPTTGQPLPSGTAGQLRFVDLANLDGTLVVDTLDEGVVHADGSLTLLGRLSGAQLRGCSLSVEEAWDR